MTINKSTWKMRSFLGVICIVLFVLILTGQQGKAQDKEFLTDYITYQNALDSYKQKDYDLAFENYRILLDKQRYQSSIELNWEMAKTETYRRNYNEAISYFEKVKDEFPAILLDKYFLNQYGWVLEKIGDGRAAKYLERAE